MLAAKSCEYACVSSQFRIITSSETKNFCRIMWGAQSPWLICAIEGYTVKVLHDKTWYQLSASAAPLCLADYNQDGILLIDINGRLVVDFNDTREWGRDILFAK